jgi:hypothetical protein
LPQPGAGLAGQGEVDEGGNDEAPIKVHAVRIISEGMRGFGLPDQSV